MGYLYTTLVCVVSQHHSETYKFDFGIHEFKFLDTQVHGSPRRSMICWDFFVEVDEFVDDSAKRHAVA